ncbi:conserved hypothetical protein (plasmid) [Burkholderia vietnamiensis G4]|uniref:Uncharacterized protein n=1 Tax=Burkholderia vietnamiensis (strain G4 / LMG 22486) TaxID=269482 RepID=A4JU91_BURVG|nr:conserved hypothetical protein [Burkholderia vietnamiensis G4]
MESCASKSEEHEMTERDLPVNAHEICVSARGDIVWVNSADGSCIGRFSKRFGIDVHRTLTDQMNGADQCLYCTHGAAGADAWEQFRSAMKCHHGIDVPTDTLSFP